jgi:hypothetical protein
LSLAGFFWPVRQPGFYPRDGEANRLAQAGGKGEHGAATRAVASSASTRLKSNMLYYVIKVVVSALVIVAVSEIAKRSTGFAAFVASLPLTSLLAFVWLRLEGVEAEKIGELSGQIFWLIIPSLVLFPLLPFLLKNGVSFWVGLGVSVAGTAGAYFLMLPLLRRMGVGL